MFVQHLCLLPEGSSRRAQHIVGSIPATVAGQPDREDENERISSDIFGYHSDNKVGDFTGYKVEIFIIIIIIIILVY